MIIRWQISTLSSKHPERDGVNGQARNVLLAEHISLIIDENTVEAKFRVTVSTRHSGTDLVTLVIHQKKPMLCAEGTIWFSSPVETLSWI